MPKVIATKIRPGYIQPYIIEQEDGSLLKSEPDDFPNRNSIFISPVAWERLEERVPNNSLFRISYIESDRYNSDDPNSCQFQARGDAESLSAREYFHVLEDSINFPEYTVLNIPYQPTRLIFLKWDEQHYVGPFSYEKPEMNYESNQYQIHFKAEHNLFSDSSRDWYALKIQRKSFPIIPVANEKIMIARLSDLRNAKHEVVDFISTEQLLKWGNEFLPTEQRFVKKDLSAYRESIRQITDVDSKFTTNRKQKLIELIGKTELWNNDRSKLISEFLNTAEGKRQIANYIEANRALFEKEIEKELKDVKLRYEDEIEKIKENRAQNAEELNAIKKEIDEYQRLRDQTKAELNKKQQEGLNRENQLLEQQQEQKRKELQDITARLSIANDIQNLRDERSFLQRRNDEETRNINKRQEEKKQLHEDIQQLQARRATLASETTAEVRKKLSDLKPYIDLLNGIVPDQTKYNSTIPRNIIRRENGPSTGREFIVEILSSLKNYGRDYEFEDIANYLVCIYQNFLTVFAGLPGIGKTSLVTYLSKSIGLQKFDRFLLIPAARGWTSQRDILGFYNPLSGNFQPSPVGLYEVLKYCHFENQDRQIQYPYWILLDEANLSPLEHYWSAFLGMCDDYAERKVKTGDPDTGGELTLPKSLRFIATINYDSTTEPLSPRMIDRVPVILLTPTNRQLYLEDNREAIESPDTLLSYEDFGRLFDNLRISDGLNPDEQRLLDKIIITLADPDSTQHGAPIIVSPRKRRLIREYCCVARDLLKEKYALRALDLAVAQYILPTINGSGPNYGKRLKKLREAIDQLDYSKSILQRIIDTGDSEYQFYRFFN